MEYPTNPLNEQIKRIALDYTLADTMAKKCDDPKGVRFWESERTKKRNEWDSLVVITRQLSSE